MLIFGGVCMGYIYDGIVKEIDALSKKTKNELEKRYIDEKLIAYNYLYHYREWSGKLSSLNGFVKCVLDTDCMGAFTVSKIYEDKPLDETNIQFEAMYTPIFSMFDAKAEDMRDTFYSSSIETNNKIRKVDVNSLQDLSIAISVVRHYTKPFLKEFKCVSAYLQGIDASLIGKTENTKNLENAEEVARVIKEAQELSSRLIELEKSVEDLHVYYS